ncbi:hypothetical protein NMY22_g1255 [Coprinellus aureogranulatus]|nr:hypothetical protein NMY22_g1255 [Coprinellus aureogranulatus]
MEKYFKVVKRSADCLNADPQAADSTGKAVASPATDSNLNAALCPPSKASLAKILLESLGDETNPITHSDLADRSDKVLSTSTGHQMTEDTMSRKRYFKERSEALHNQQKPSAPSAAPTAGIFRNTRIYINGYLEGTTDIEIKRLVIEGGGKVLFAPSTKYSHPHVNGA